MFKTSSNLCTACFEKKVLDLTKIVPFFLHTWHPLRFYIEPKLISIQNPEWNPRVLYGNSFGSVKKNPTKGSIHSPHKTLGTLFPRLTR